MLKVATQRGLKRMLKPTLNDIVVLTQICTLIPCVYPKKLRGNTCSDIYINNLIFGLSAI